MRLRTIGIGILLSISVLGMGQTRIPFQKHQIRRPGWNRFGNPRQQRVENLPEVLRKVISSSAHIRYQETREVSVHAGNKLASHIEFVLRSGRETRITFPQNSPFKGQIIVDNGQNRQWYIPRAKIIRVRPSFQDQALSGLVDRMGRQRHLRVQVFKGGEIAGIQTEGASIEAPNGRLLQRLWIDPRTGAILKRVGFGPRGNEIASYEVKQIRYQPFISPKSFVLSIPYTRRITPVDVLKRVARQVKVPVIMIPETSRFRLVASRIIQRMNVSILKSVYQGPTGARISLYELNHSVDASALRRDAGKRERVLVRNISGTTVVLIGAVSHNKLESLASHFKRL